MLRLGGLFRLLLRKSPDLVSLLVREDGIWLALSVTPFKEELPAVPCLWEYSVSLNSNLSTWDVSVSCPVKDAAGFRSVTYTVQMGFA